MSIIDNLLNHYFEGTSTAGEEKILKDYFRSHQIAPQHTIYKPLFDLFDQEKGTLLAPRFVIPEAQEKRKRPTARSLRIASAGVAAAILLGIILFPFKGGSEKQSDYVVIVNGKRISNPQKAKEYAEAAFARVSAIQKESYQTLGKAKEMQEKYNAARIIREAKNENYIQTTSNQQHLKK